jgi:hypothetical protein
MSMLLQDSECSAYDEDLRAEAMARTAALHHDLAQRIKGHIQLLTLFTL